MFVLGGNVSVRLILCTNHLTIGSLRVSGHNRANEAAFKWKPW